MTAESLRMAMAALDVSVRQVASGAGVAAATIIRIRHGQVASRSDTLQKVQDWLISQGAMFRQENRVVWVGVENPQEADTATSANT